MSKRQRKPESRAEFPFTPVNKRRRQSDNSSPTPRKSKAKAVPIDDFVTPELRAFMKDAHVSLPYWLALQVG